MHYTFILEDMFPIFSMNLSTSLSKSFQKSLQEELCSDTLFDYRKLVNNKDFSDVVIITASGDKLFAHKLILSIRCPAMLQVCILYHYHRKFSCLICYIISFWKRFIYVDNILKHACLRI